EPQQPGLLPLPGLPDAIWMPDSSHVLYVQQTESEARILERAVGGGPPRELTRISRLGDAYEVSPNGKALLYKASQWSLYSVRIDKPDEKPRLLVETQESVMTAHFSPDGRWVVYQAGSPDKPEIYVQPYAFGGIRKQISSDAGRGPVWRGDGKEILYRNRLKLDSVRVQVRWNDIRTGATEALFDVRMPAGLVGSSEPLAVTHDGSRILFAQGVVQPEPQMSYVMTAWDN